LGYVYIIGSIRDGVPPACSLPANSPTPPPRRQERTAALGGVVVDCCAIDVSVPVCDAHLLVRSCGLRCREETVVYVDELPVGNNSSGLNSFRRGARPSAGRSFPHDGRVADGTPV